MLQFLIYSEGRVWIIKLVERRENPGITFESVKAPLLDSLRAAKIEKLREQAEHELRAKAKITYP